MRLGTIRLGMRSSGCHAAGPADLTRKHSRNIDTPTLDAEERSIVLEGMGE